MIELILGLLSLLILCVFAAIALLVISENKTINRYQRYVYPRYYRRNDESYSAPYCSHCGSKLYHKQNYCSECGYGFIWPTNKEGEELLNEQDR